MSKNTNPIFSVIIPTYNRVDYLCFTVESVLKQTFKEFELIIVDDGSTDGTKNMVSEYTDPRLKYVYHDNKGVSYSRNRGLELSKGVYMAFLDSDDRWVPHKLETTLEYINKYPEIQIFHTEELWYKNDRIQNQKKKHKKPDGYVYLNALPICCISMSTAVLNKEVINKVGMFDESLPACEDYDFWLRTAIKYKVKLIPEYLTIKYGGRPDQLSAQHGLDKFRIRSLEKMLNSNLQDKEMYAKTREELVRKCGIFSKGAKKRGKFEEAEHYIKLKNRY